MAMLSVGVYTLIIPMIVVITVAAFFIYKVFYDKHTNKVLESGETKKRKWIAPWGVALIAFGLQLVILAGMMFPLSMFMAKREASETNLELSEENPILFDISDSVMYQIDDKRYECISLLSEDGITLYVYRKTGDDEYNQFIILGEIDKEPYEPVSVYLFCEKNNELMGCCMVGSSANDEREKVYFKCEWLKGKDTPASIRVGLKNGIVHEMNSDETNFDKDVKLEF